MFIDTTKRMNICEGLLVEIVAEEDKSSQNLTRGYVKEILSKKDNKSGISVILSSGIKGNVKNIVSKDDLKKENFKFYNLFFFDNTICSIWDKKNNKYVIIPHLNKNNNTMENVALLFNDVKIAKNVIDSLNNKDYMLKRINRKKTIVENFKTLDVNFFSINTSRKLSFEKMIEWENYFKNMK